MRTLLLSTNRKHQHRPSQREVNWYGIGAAIITVVAFATLAMRLFPH